MNTFTIYAQVRSKEAYLLQADSKEEAEKLAKAELIKEIKQDKAHFGFSSFETITKPTEAKMSFIRETE